MFHFITKIIVASAVFFGSLFGTHTARVVSIPTPTVKVSTSPTAKPTTSDKETLTLPSPKLIPTFTPTSTQTPQTTQDCPWYDLRCKYYSTPTPTPAVDFCRNIPGNQTVLPLGMYRSVDGDCFNIPLETPTPTPTPTPAPSVSQTPAPTPTPLPALLIKNVSLQKSPQDKPGSTSRFAYSLSINLNRNNRIDNEESYIIVTTTCIHNGQTFDWPTFPGGNYQYGGSYTDDIDADNGIGHYSCTVKLLSNNSSNASILDQKTIEFDVE